MSPFSRVIGGTMCPQSMRRQLTPTRAQVANMWRLAAGLVGLPGRREMPEHGQLCGDCSQAGTARLGRLQGQALCFGNDHTGERPASSTSAFLALRRDFRRSQFRLSGQLASFAPPVPAAFRCWCHSEIEHHRVAVGSSNPVRLQQVDPIVRIGCFEALRANWAFWPGRLRVVQKQRQNGNTYLSLNG